MEMMVVVAYGYNRCSVKTRPSWNVSRERRQNAAHDIYATEHPGWRLVGWLIQRFTN